jgi:hypothetical protein
MKNRYKILLILSFILNIWQYFSISKIEKATLGGWKSTSSPALQDKEIMGFIDNKKNCSYIGRLDDNGDVFSEDKKVGHLEWVFFDRMKIVNDSGQVFYYRRALY